MIIPATERIERQCGHKRWLPTTLALAEYGYYLLIITLTALARTYSKRKYCGRVADGEAESTHDPASLLSVGRRVRISGRIGVNASVRRPSDVGRICTTLQADPDMPRAVLITSSYCAAHLMPFPTSTRVASSRMGIPVRVDRVTMALKKSGQSC